MTARLEGIAIRSARRAPMRMLAEVAVTTGAGLAGDYGRRPGRRQVTVLAAECWAAALAELGATDLPWTIRRANLFVAGIDLRREPGSRLRIGQLELEITGETDPCDAMDRQHHGLKAALMPDWRGGVTCRVTAGGTVRLGDPVTAVSASAPRA